MPTNDGRRRWHAYYTEKRIVHQWFQVDLMKELDVQRVLEVGPYFGLVSAMLANAGYEVTTLDITPEPPGPGVVRHIRADIREVRPEQLAGHDVILCCETLEHIPWIEAGEALSRFAASAVPWLIVSVPYQAFQFGFSLYMNRYLWRKHSFFKKFRFLSEFPAPEGDDWEPHKWEIGYRGYSVPRLRDMVTGAGYEIVRQEFTSGCRSIFLVARNALAAGSGA
ncbi:MAG: hypothetical protein IH993_04700 [Proteobacteria bacterium]|nr:hypothetical protein [Pseudomonadota bacterium]